MNLRKWFKEHSLKLLAIRDTPNAIAGGVAIGIFFGFTPLVGLKTLLSIFFAWLTRSNIVAAAIAALSPNGTSNPRPSARTSKTCRRAAPSTRRRRLS